nr:aldose epimerase [Bacilli bacterium]
MYEVRKIPGKLTIYELYEQKTNSTVRICPERGGMVIAFAPYGEEILYLDEAKFVQTNENMRGGIPILWPICGALPQGELVDGEQRYRLPNHGLLRQRAWRVQAMTNEAEASLTVRIESDAITLATFPFDFVVTMTYTLRDGVLSIEQSYHNAGEQSMPMYGGFHPYFNANQYQVATNIKASYYRDLKDGTKYPMTEIIDIGSTNESYVVPICETPTFDVILDQQRTITMTVDPSFKHLVLWTDHKNSFVCIEPWMALSGALGEKEDWQYVPPHQTMTATYTITTKKA